MNTASILLFWLLWLSPAVGSAMKNFSATSTSFKNNGSIGVPYSCQGRSPQFSLSNIPKETKSVLLIIDDPDAQQVVGHTFVHMIAQFDATTTNIPEGKLDLSATHQLKNDAGTARYYGPCPPKGPEHSYYFTWLALVKDIDISNYSVDDFRDTWNKTSPFYTQEAGNIIGFAQYMGTFRK